MFCTNCGHETGDAAFCTTCGTARPGSSATPPPPPEARPPAQPSPAPPTASPPTAPPPPVGPGVAPAAPSGPKRSRLGLVVAGVGVVALVAVVVLAVLARGGNSGGAKDPASAVRGLSEAISAQDPLAVVATMNPDEVERLGDVYSSVEDRARRIGYAADGDSFRGVGIDVGGLTLKATELNDTVARVKITGGTIAYDITESDLGTQLARLLDHYRSRDGSSGTLSGRVGADELNIADTPLTDIMVVKRNGGWYVSPAFTAADFLTKVYDLPPGAFEDGDLKPTEATAESPEAAAEELARAVAATDLDQVVTQLAGPSLLAVQPYKAALRKLIDEDGNLDKAGAKIGDIKFSVEELDSDRSKVIIDSVEGTATWSDDGEVERAEFDWDGTCLTVKRNRKPAETCITNDTRRLGVDQAFVVAVKDGDKWRISPIETALTYISEVAPKLDANLIARLLDAPEIVEPSGAAKIGEPLKAKLNDAGFAVYTLAVKADEAFTVNVENRRNEFVGVTVIKPDGGRELARPGSVFEAADAGDWKLLVGQDRLASATVKVTIGSVLQRDVTVGKPTSGALREPGQVVRYRLDSGEATTVDIDFDNDDLDWRLIDQDDSAVTREDDGTFALDPSHSYTVEVGSRDGTIGEYKLSITSKPDFVLGTGKTTTANGEITSALSIQTIPLEVRSGTTVVATVSSKVPGMDLTMTVVDPDGTRTAYNENGPDQAEAVRFFPSQSVTYTLEFTATGAFGKIFLEVEKAE